MTSIDTLLKHAAPEAQAPDAGVVDADLARGRAALVTARRRRTHRRMAAGAAGVAAVGIAGVVLGTSGSSQPGAAAPHRTPVARLNITPRAHAHVSRRVSRVELVDYQGKQLAGFTVDQVPQGWALSTSTQDALLITPNDTPTNDNPDDFVGKLAVLTSSVDEHGLGDGDAVTVDGQPGRVSTQGDIQMLRYNAPNGFGIDIQAPTSLHWTTQQIIAFAQGVHVTSHAVHSRG